MNITASLNSLMQAGLKSLLQTPLLKQDTIPSEKTPTDLQKGSNLLRPAHQREDQAILAQTILQEKVANSVLSSQPGLKEVFEGTKTLSQKTAPSKEVGVVQDLLRSEGYKINDEGGKYRGHFGPQTEQVVRAYQAKHGLQVDGIVGKQTLRSLLGMQPESSKKQNPVSQSSATTAVKSKKLSGQDFITRYAPYAIETQKKTGIPASITLAQAALESNWGKSAPGNNFFGVKGTGPAGTQDLKTKEVYGGKTVTVTAQFRKYNSPEESFTDHAKVIQNSRALKHAMDHTGSAREFITALQSGKAKYATDPQYVDKIMSIVDKYQLENYDKIGMGTTTPPAVSELILK